MGEVLSASARSPLPSSGLPSRLNRRPRHCLPTGTEMGAPVSRPFMPRTRPSVESMAMVRTTLLPMCWATSVIRSMPLSASTMWMALSIWGR